MNGPSLPATAADAARFIDHTALKPETSEREVHELCAEALEHAFAAVCVATQWLPLCARELAGSSVRVACVIDFPHGASATGIAREEALRAQDMGAHELDTVFPHGLLASGDEAGARAKLEALVQATRPGHELKVILETGANEPDVRRRAATIATEAGAHFLKTSTGFHGGGATIEDVRMLREVGGPDRGVKASGGIRDRATFEAMIAAGATRIGTSSAIGILKEYGS